MNNTNGGDGNNGGVGGGDAAENAGDPLLNFDDPVAWDDDMDLDLHDDEVKNDAVEQNPIEAYFNSFPCGFRFCPNDDELIDAYLKKKANNEPLPPNKMHEENIYNYTPQQISEKYAPMDGKDDIKEWYFFTPRERKYSQGSRPKRAAGTGFWKATAAEKNILDDNNTVIGTKKLLVFHEGSPPIGVKTNWLMHEYVLKSEPRKRTSPDDMTLDDHVLCRIRKRQARGGRETDNGENSIQPAGETSRAAAAVNQERANGENSIQSAEETFDVAAAVNQERIYCENSIQPMRSFAPAAAVNLERTYSENSIPPMGTVAAAVAVNQERIYGENSILPMGTVAAAVAVNQERIYGENSILPMGTFAAAAANQEITQGENSILPMGTFADVEALNQEEANSENSIPPMGTVAAATAVNQEETSGEISIQPMGTFTAAAAAIYQERVNEHSIQWMENLCTASAANLMRIDYENSIQSMRNFADATTVKQERADIEISIQSMEIFATDQRRIIFNGENSDSLRELCAAADQVVVTKQARAKAESSIRWMVTVENELDPCKRFLDELMKNES